MWPSLCAIVEPHRVGLDGDASLPFDIHGVEQLLSHVTLLNGPGRFEETIGQGRLPMVDVRDYREVADTR